MSAENEIKWTEQQKRAIKARGSDVLVTASAGTGKTAVLSGRCVDILSDKSACPDVGGILVLTFTDMAAEQMRSRIAGQLREAYLKGRDRHLLEQLILLQGADISTIHSFCKRLITEHFYKLGLDPAFGIIDSDEQKLLKAEVLEKTIDWAWEQSNLTQGLQQLFYKRQVRSSDGFLGKIIALSDFLDGVVSRQNWFERAVILTEAVNPFATRLGEKQKQIVTSTLGEILDQLALAQNLYERENPGGEWAEKCAENFVRPVEECAELLNAREWDDCAERIRNFEKPRVNKPKDIEGAIAELIKNTVKEAIDCFGGLAEFAVLNPDYLDRVSGAVGLQTRVLVELVRKFDQLYGQAKRAVNCLDFADLEHYALKLLTVEDSSPDELSPSETALALRSRYRYIFVDEFQDINSVQQTILGSLSGGGNVFEVGDAKQSIYAFRGAEPEIFLEQLKNASVETAKGKNGLRVDLNANFRSSRGILEFVNAVFSRIMTESFTKIDYDESARLRAGDKFEESVTDGSVPAVELHILDEPDKEHDAGGIRNRQRQAAMIARRIKQIVGVETGKAEFEIFDKNEGKNRDVEYRDIVILMRSLAGKADFVEVLRLAGVLVSCQGIAGYFEATEINDLVNLLKVLDNPQRDIELAAVLRSPFFNVTDTELAMIRIAGKGDKSRQNFYDCFLRYCREGSDEQLREKLGKINERIECWRTKGRRGGLADLVWAIYRQTGYLSFVTALPNGRARKANLLKLHDRAIQFESFGGNVGAASLRRFVEFVEKLRESGQDWSPAEPETAAGNAVRVLSVHKSKGLEFPVVFLAELDSDFNKRDVQNECLSDAGETLGLQIIDRESNSRLNSLAHQVIAERRLARSLAEEMRILYVAMTRARERLILTACEKQKRCREIIEQSRFFAQDKISDWQLRRSKSAFEWVLRGLCEQENLRKAFETDVSPCDGDLFRAKVYDQQQVQELTESVLALRAGKGKAAQRRIRKSAAKRKASGRFKQIKESLSWRYGFAEAPKLPAKQSVTALTHRNDEFAKMDYSRALERRPKIALPADSVAEIDARVIGTATHLVLAELDLGKPVDSKAVEETKASLTAGDMIDAAAAEMIDAESITAFFKTELGQMMSARENTVWREWPFTFALPATELIESSQERGAASDEVIIVQGIIDVLVRAPQGLVIIDFKTDHITKDQLSERTEAYAQQLKLYGQAAGAILKAEIASKWLYFLRPGCAKEVS